jgi:hypothetical protein
MEAVRSLWANVVFLMAALPDEWSRPPPCGWRIPLHADGDFVGVAVLTADEDGSGRLVVATVLKPDMVPYTEAVAALYDAREAVDFRRAAGVAKLMGETVGAPV